ncbi:MAG: site-specific DNA-methyltransferase [Azoarcus sp.]|nr:site-specific DNA-methyltransferase [Azoarcus sp.]
MYSPQSILNAIPLDRSEIPQGKLNIETKERSNLFAWNGQFSPQFVDALLEKYTLLGMRVLDPFSGSGTVFHECARYGLAVTGIEVNPAAYLLSKTYELCNLQVHERVTILATVDTALALLVGNGAFAVSSQDRKSFANIGSELIKQFRYADKFVHSLFEALIILADFYKGVDSAKLQKTWGKLRKTVLTLPYSREPIQALIGDGRYPSKMKPFDLVLTSPPYINVYNYHQQYRASAEVLGWDVLHVARTEIGSNRKNRGNRFLTVIQYCLDLAILLENLWDATTVTARQIFVLGRESRVRGVSFLNGEIFARLAVEAVGYRIVLKQEREFMNRFGQHIYEDIIHIEKEIRHQNTENSARKIAALVLQQSVLLANTDDVKEDIERAVAAVEAVQPSPRFNALDSHSEKTLRSTYAISDATPRKTECNIIQREVATI